MRSLRIARMEWRRATEATEKKVTREVKVPCFFDPRENADVKHKQSERQKVHNRVVAAMGGQKPEEELRASDGRDENELSARK